MNPAIICWQAKLLIITASLVFSVSTLGAVENPEIDPDLALGNKYSYIDNYSSDLSDTSRELTEKHYLRYLERNPDSPQRSYIYFHLGAMYGSGRSGFDEPIDRDTADAYLTKAVEAAPTGIDREMLIMRTQWSSSAVDQKERYERDVEVLAFLRKLDEETIASRVIVPTPRPLPPPVRGRMVDPDGVEVTSGMIHRYDADAAKAQQVEDLVGLVQTMTESQRYNLKAALKHADNREKKLEQLAQRFPDDPLGEWSLAELGPGARLVTPVLAPVVAPTPPPVETHPSTLVAQASPAVVVEPALDGGTWVSPLVAGGVVVLAAITAFFLWRVYNAKTRSTE